MPGSGIAVNYEDAAQNLHEVGLQGQQILHNAMDEITAHVNTAGAGVPVVIYNPLSWARTGPVEVEAQFPEAVRSVEARDSSGKPLLTQVVSVDASTYQARVRVLATNVPPLGYEVIHLLPTKNARSLPTPLKARGTTLENEFLRVTVDPKSGCITSLFNKADQKETLAPGASGNLLQAFVDQPRQFDAWNIDPDYEKHGTDLKEAQEVKRVESGPVRAVIPIAASAHNGALPPSHSFVQVGPSNVILTVIKKAEDDDALIFRYYEFGGKQSRVRLQLPERATRAVETNLMEKEEHPLSLTADGRELTVPTGPYEIKTVKVWFSHPNRSQAVAVNH
jgi:alpha-mannosidase